MERQTLSSENPISDEPRLAYRSAPMEIRLLADERFDFARPVPLRKSYVVACSDRSSSTFLCASLWRTGRLGAPWEYLNASFEDLRGTFAMPVHRSVASTLMKRLYALDSAEYITKLLRCRTSSNGVFGLKARFDDFRGAVKEVPELLNMLAPVSYIYFDHRDKLAQAASVVRAVLGSRMAPAGGTASETPTVRYDREMIATFLGRLERQRLAWRRWFEASNIEPFVVFYEDAIADVVRTVAKILKVENDAADEVSLPTFSPADDGLAEAWAERFTRETRPALISGSPTPPTATHWSVSSILLSSPRQTSRDRLPLTKSGLK